MLNEPGGEFKRALWLGQSDGLGVYEGAKRKKGEEKKEEK